MNETEQTLLKELKPEERFLFQKALRRLSLYDDTCRGLYDRLKRETFENKPVESESVKRVIELLVRLNYLNERRYCEELTRRLIRSGYGPRRVEAELHRRRFAPKVIGRILEETEERADIGEVLSKRLSTRPVDLMDRAARGKVYQYLVRMGFSGADAQNAIERQIAAQREEEDT